MSRNDPPDPFAPALPTALPRFQTRWRMHSFGQPVHHRAAPADPRGDCEPPIMAQARDIIDTVLADSDPSLAEVQQCLRKNLAAHSGCPSKALLAHLLETRHDPIPDFEWAGQHGARS